MKLIVAIVAVLASPVLAPFIHAQSLPDPTNAPTKIETLEIATNAIIVKGLGDAGSVSVGSGLMTFQLKESFNLDTGARLLGLTLEFTQGSFHRREVIDYDELAPLLKAFEAVMSVNHGVTQLPNYMVQFKTRSGFEVIGIGNQGQSYTQLYLQLGNDDRMVVNPTQMGQLRTMIANCKTALEALGAGK